MSEDYSEVKTEAAGMQPQQANENAPKKRGFSFKNFLAGLIVGMVLVGAAASAVHFASSNAAGKAQDEAASDEVLTDEVENKIEMLETIIDQIYLEDADKDAMAEGLYKGMIDALDDPYSVYYDAEESQALNESIDGRYSGIGATLSQNADTLALTIIKCFENTPASDAGLQPGDIIVEVDGTEVTGMDTSSAVALIKGEEGTDVELKIYREGETDYLTKVLTRRKIDIPTVGSAMLEDQIGYIQITSFDNVTTKQFQEEFAKLEKEGMQGLIIDLRDNPGGMLDVVCDISEMFVPEGLIVYTEDKDGNRTEFKSESSEDEVFGRPLAVLVNGNSASASEIFAGVIQDRGAGTIIGTTTYGKGVVQQLLDLQDKTSLKITISKYFTPNGNDINHKGITPDIEADLDEELKTKSVITMEEDNQIQKAVEIIENEISQSE